MTAVLRARNLFKSFREARQSKSILSQVREYRNFLSIAIETEDFIVRTVEHPAELLRVLQLRHDIFVEEWQGRRAFHRLDVDEYDFHADHLVIYEKATQSIIGTYRLLCSRFTDEFYSSTEFDIDGFLQKPDTMLELGRACIRPTHRNGTTLNLLWKGLAQYASLSHSRYLFGCSSVKSTSPQLMSNLFFELVSKGQYSSEYSIAPVDHYRLPQFDIARGERLSAQDRRQVFPPLLRSYLHAGAKVYGPPALDRDFECCDLFTILDLTELDAKFKSHYF